MLTAVVTLIADILHKDVSDKISEMHKACRTTIKDVDNVTHAVIFKN